MSWEIITVIALIFFALGSFIIEKISVDVTAIVVMGIILVIGLISDSTFWPEYEEVLGVFANPAPLTVAAMFLISAALERTGAIEGIAASLSRLTKLGYKPFLLLLVLVTACASACINNTAVVIVLLPVVLTLSRQMKAPASKLLIPLSYASMFGGCCTLIGTSTNIIVSSSLESYNLPPLGMFELSAVGVPLMALGALYLAFFGDKLLPVRDTLMSMLSDEDRKEYLIEAYINRDSKHIGMTLKESKLLTIKGMRLVEVIRRGRSFSARDEDIRLADGDRLIFACKPSAVASAASVSGVDFSDLQTLGIEQISTQEGYIVEGVVGPTSSLIGRTTYEVNFRQRFRTALLAIHRRGANVREKMANIRFQFGDTLLLMGAEAAIDNVRKSEELILLDKPAIPTKNRKKKLPIAIAVVAGIILGAASGYVPIVVGAILGVGVLFLTKCLKPKEAYQSIEWRILILIYGMLALGVCMEKSGFSRELAEFLVETGQNYIPVAYQGYVMLAMVYIITSVLTEVLSNNATAVIMAPIGIGIALVMGVDPRPFVVVIAIAASASFSTPIGYQTNTYVYGVGGYRFFDFFKIGFYLNILYFVGAMLLVPLIWPLG